jgi:CubicO group peptidase (beta-lactamase class C family)
MADVEALRAHARAELGRWRVPGLELAVVANGAVTLAEGFGLRNVAKNLPATPETRFHHGSTGKAFTGALTGTLVDAGLLEWDRPVREYLPEFRLPDGALGDRITVADLLSHRSGLARHEWAWLANPSLTRAELVHRLRYLDSGYDLRTSFVYCNLAYLTVGHLIASVTGSTWEEQMRRRVLEPLGMTHTVTSVDEAQALDDHAQPYAAGKPVSSSGAPGSTKRADGNASPPPREIPWRRSDQIAPAGQMISCAVDIARWLLLQLGNGEIDRQPAVSRPCRVISAGALAETRRIHTPVDLPGPDPDMRFYGYGFGWVLGTYRGRRLVWHNGGIDGFKTDIALLPDDEIAVAASCNTLETNLPLALVFHVIDVLLGEEPKPWTKNLQAQSAAATPAAKPRVVRGTHPSHPLEEYAGDYEHPGYGTLQVAVHGRGLQVCLGELDVSAHHRHYDTWTLRYEPLDETWPLTFLADSDGHVCAAEIPLEPSIKPIRFEAPAKETKT